jgi:phage tail sheath protein FI
MPSALTYPGVYVEEIPSGVRPIAGVATSVTAFVGRAARGPANEATTINSFGDFERIFGGLWLGNSLGYAVRDFFLNGGTQAIVVRLVRPDQGDPQANPPVAGKPSKASLTVGALPLEARSDGSWGVALRASTDTDNISADTAAALGVAKTDLFNLTVRDTSEGGASERFLNLTFKASSRQVDKVLAAESQLVAYKGTINESLAVAKASDALSQKETAYAAAKATLADKQNSGASDTDVQKAKADVDKAKGELDQALTDAAAAVSHGGWLTVAEFLPAPGEANKKGLFALEQADIFNLLCIPPYKGPAAAVDVDVNLVSAAAAYCEKRRAMLIVDAPKDWGSKTTAVTKFRDANTDYVGTRSRNAALFFPRLNQPDPLRDGQVGTFAACGAVAGVMARTDAQRGVWKAPAGLDATLTGVPQLSVQLTDAENGELNPLGVNCLRAIPPTGRVIWGSRTLRGADGLADEYKYLPVRRTALYIEESLYRGLKWVVFEPNDEPLWSQIRLNAGAFMHNLFRQGAFQGSTPREAYLVKCDKETTTQNDIILGVVNVVIGFAPLKPAEFVIIKLQQLAGQIEV